MADGGNAVDHDLVTADAGLFGPDSVTWRVHADPAMAPAGLRALALQALHPVAMTGVEMFSDFRERPWNRLIQTAEYVGTVTYGTTGQALAAGARVREVHARLGGLDPRSGRVFRVDDPDLLTWVHVAEVESFATTVQRCGGGLSDDDVDRYYAEQTRAAALLGLDPADVPASRADVAAYYADVRPELHPTPFAREVLRFVLAPPMPALAQAATPARPAWLGLAALAVGLLPAWARRLYGLPGLPTTDLGARLAGRALRTGLLAIPEPLREGPHRREARRRLEAAAV